MYGKYGFKCHTFFHIFQCWIICFTRLREIFVITAQIADFYDKFPTDFLLWYHNFYRGKAAFSHNWWMAGKSYWLFEHLRLPVKNTHGDIKGELFYSLFYLKVVSILVFVTSIVVTFDWLNTLYKYFFSNLNLFSFFRYVSWCTFYMIEDPERWQ